MALIGAGMLREYDEPVISSFQGASSSSRKRVVSKKNKVKTCKFNANRDSSDVVDPYCTWRPATEESPPHVYWASHKCTENICYKCKAFKPIDK